MICRSHYTTLHDACVLFDRVLTPFILLFFLRPFPTPSPNELRDRDDKEHVNNFCLRVELPHRADLCFIFSTWQRRSCQPRNCDRSARRHDFLRILVTRYYHHGSGMKSFPPIEYFTLGENVWFVCHACIGRIGRLCVVMIFQQF